MCTARVTQMPPRGHAPRCDETKKRKNAATVLGANKQSPANIQPVARTKKLNKKIHQIFFGL